VTRRERDENVAEVVAAGERSPVRMRFARDLLAAAVASAGLACALPAPSPSPLVAVVAPAAAPDASPPDVDPKRAIDGGVTSPMNAPLAIVRGTLEPSHPDATGGPRCPSFDGARWGEPPIHVAVEGARRHVHVFARARGPIGVLASDQCASASANAWAKVDVDDAEGEIEIRVADIDAPGERRGQTSPFVVVVSDGDATPTEEPDARAPLGPNDVAVRWSLVPTTCTNPEYAICERATIELGGAVKKRIPLRRLLMGQSGCWPDGTGVVCGGPSGSSDVTLTSSANGTVRVSEYQQSDGYCPPPEDCGSTIPWTTFTLPKGSRLVPDPEGTFPPELSPPSP
jgi:hypothetical protein